MHLPYRLALGSLLLVCGSGCGSSLSQPFDQMKGQQMTVYRLQNYEVPAQASAPAAGALPFPIPPQIQSWITAGAAALPPGLIPPGLIPGIGPAAPTQQQDARFHGFRILGWMAMTDEKQKDEVLDIFGHDSGFQASHGNCMYAEFGFAMAQKNGAPGDVLVSLSCEQVQAFNFTWPYSKTGLTPDSSKRIVAVVRKSFGG